MLDEPLIPDLLIEKHLDLGLSHGEIVEVWKNGDSYQLPTRTQTIRKKIEDREVHLSFIRKWEGEYVLKDIWIEDHTNQ